jgi:hypothetical protein
MRLLAAIPRQPAGVRARGRFHTAALLVIFAALAWMFEAGEDRPEGRAAEPTAALQGACHGRADRATPGDVEWVPDDARPTGLVRCVLG